MDSRRAPLYPRLQWCTVYTADIITVRLMVIASKEVIQLVGFCTGILVGAFLWSSGSNFVSCLVFRQGNFSFLGEVYLRIINRFILRCI